MLDFYNILILLVVIIAIALILILIFRKKLSETFKKHGKIFAASIFALIIMVAFMFIYYSPNYYKFDSVESEFKYEYDVEPTAFAVGKTSAFAINNDEKIIFDMMIKDNDVFRPDYSYHYISQVKYIGPYKVEILKYEDLKDYYIFIHEYSFCESDEKINPEVEIFDSCGSKFTRACTDDKIIICGYIKDFNDAYILTFDGEEISFSQDDFDKVGIRRNLRSRPLQPYYSYY